MPPDSWSCGRPSRELSSEPLSQGLIASFQNPQQRGTALAIIGVGVLCALMVWSAGAALQTVNQDHVALLMQAGSAIVPVMTAVLASGSWSRQTFSVCSSGLACVADGAESPMTPDQLNWRLP